MSRFLVFFGVLAQGLACESVYVPLCEMGGQSDQVFVGTATEERTGSGTFLFRVDEPLKGIAPGTKEVEVGPGPCGIGYQIGARYLIASRHADGLSHGFSSGEPAEDAAPSVDFFRALARGEHRTTIRGSVAENVEDHMVRFEMDVDHRPGLSSVEITVSKDGSDYATRADPFGAYSLQVPEAGTYELTAKLPGHATAQPTYKLDVAPDSCKELNLGLWTASRVTGRVFRAHGEPAAGIVVQLMPALKERNSPPHAKTDATGKFEFVNIPPGDYVLGVNITGLSSKLPYATRFFPGTPERSEATIVKIAGAQAIEGLDFQIGEPKPTRRIIVEAKWPDGRPVINASVDCSSSSADLQGAVRDFVLRYFDLNGEATCEVLADNDYKVDVDRLSWKASDRPIQPVTARPRPIVSAGTNSVRLSFIIDPVNDISAKEAPMSMADFNDTDF
jgi:Carboxypeptidase regulatory-like domain